MIYYNKTTRICPDKSFRYYYTLLYGIFHHLEVVQDEQLTLYIIIQNVNELAPV